MSPINKSSIAHLTELKENLVGILKEGFRIFYCSERIQTTNGDRIVGVPMVSFTEMPINNEEVLVKAYGSYGIVLTREWAQKKRLNPVLYLEPSSVISKSFDIIIDQVFADRMVRISDGTEIQKASMDFLRFSKNYIGILIRKRNVVSNNYPFYLEREWRYVVDFHEIEKMFIPYYEYEDGLQREITNAPLVNMRLEFEVSDVEYLFVKDNFEIEEMKQELEKLKSGNRFSEENINNLKSRVTSFPQMLLNTS